MHIPSIGDRPLSESEMLFASIQMTSIAEYYKLPIEDVTSSVIAAFSGLKTASQKLEPTSESKREQKAGDHITFTETPRVI